MELEGPTVDPDRFRGEDDPYPGHWRDDAAPTAWEPESALLAAEFRAVLGRALASCPSGSGPSWSCVTCTGWSRRRCASCWI